MNASSPIASSDSSQVPAPFVPGALAGVKIFLLSGVLLNLAAAIGMRGGVDSFLFEGPLLIHLFGFLWAVVWAVRFIWGHWLAAPFGSVRVISAALLILGPLLSLSLAFLPITARDALIHHLAVPKWWLQQGVIAPIHWHDWSYYPMALQTAYAAFLEWEVPGLAAPYHWCFLVILVGLTGMFTSVLGSGSVALCSMAIVGTLPVVLKLGSIPLVDLGLSAYSASAMLLALYWRQLPQLGTLCWLGLALGLAASTKPNGLLIAAITGMTFLILGITTRAKHSRVVGFGLMCVCAGITFSPWPTQNLVHTGNPLYPLAKRFFPTSEVAQSEHKTPAPLSPLETRRLVHGESWAEISAIPLRIFLQGEDDNPRRFDGRLSPLLLLSFAALFLKRRSSVVTYLCVVSFGYLFLALLLTDTRIRYLAPIYAPLSALSALVLARAAERVAKPALLYSALLLLQLIWSGVYLTGLLSRVKAVEYFSGSLSRDAYLEYAIPEYRIIRWMNQHLSHSSQTILLLTGNRFYYYDTPVRSEGYHSAPTFLEMVRSASDSTELTSKLSMRSVTHLLIHGARLGALAATDLSPEERARLDEFLQKHCRLEFKDRGFFLFSIRL
jgi:hypothetical protein